MSFFENLRQLLRGGSAAPAGPGIVGTWQVTEIPLTHPFSQYVLELRSDGALAWFAVLPTFDAGEVRVEGSGTWRASDAELHYTSGENQGTLRYERAAEQLVLDGLPATKIGPGVRCVFARG